MRQTIPSAPPDLVLQVFPGNSEMARRMRSVDWAATPVGAVEGWPLSLRNSVAILLQSRFPMFIWWGERELTYFYNDAYVPVLGSKHPQALGRSGREVWTEIWHDVGPFADDVFRRGEANWSEELPLMMERRGYLEETFFTFSYSPITEQSGEISGLLCACTEDTQRVLSQRRLRTQRGIAGDVAGALDKDEVCSKAAKHLASNLEDLPFSLIYLLDDDGEHARLHSSSANIVAGKPVETVSLSASSSEDPWSFLQVLRTGAIALLAEPAKGFREKVPTGVWNEAPSQALVLPLRGVGSARPFGFAVFGLSPRRVLDDDYRGFCELIAGHIATGLANAQAHAEERRRADTLAELDRAKTTFFSNVSHEFRTPLTLMLAPLQDALSRADLPDGVRDSLLITQRSSVRLLKLVNTLLEFSRIEAGRADASYEKLDVAALTNELVSMFRAAIESAGLELEVDIRPLRREAWLDRAMWEKIVLNLLSNAFKFTREGGISVLLAESEHSFDLVVSDSGIGIPKDELGRIFERFHRLPVRDARTQEGSGIGLALVQELVRLHGGTIRVESAAGDGTSFTVSIPTGRAHLPPERIAVVAGRANDSLMARAYVEEVLSWLPHEPASAQDDAGPRSGDVDPSLKSARIVLADDNRDMREYLTRLLSDFWTVEPVADGEAALEAIRANPPDLVVSDIMMPRVDGLDLLRLIRDDAATRAIPVILLSARAGEGARVEGIGAGADDYLTKPFSARELIARISTHLELARVRKEAHARIRHSEERYRSLVEASSSIVWRAAADGSLLEAPKWKEVTGGDFEALEGWGWVEAIHPEDRERTVAAWKSSLEAGTVARAEHRLRTKSGDYRWASVSAVPVLDERGQLREWVGTIADIHDARESERAIKESEKRFRSMADSAPVMIWVTDADGNCSYLSQRWYEFTGQTPASGLGKGWLDAVHPEDRAKSGDAFFAANETAEAISLEYRLRHHGGGYRWAIDSAIPRLGENGEFLGYIGSVIDIDDRRTAELERERLLVDAHRARLEAEQANTAKDEFLAVLSHELRSPMNAMLGWLQILKTAGKRDQDLVGKAADTIERNIWIQSQVINDLLDVSRIMSGKLEIDRERVDVYSMVAGCVESMRPSAEGKQLALELVAADRNLEVIGDSSRLQQVMGNLIGNAIKFSSPGATITVVIDGSEGDLRISVRDTGQGIDAEFLPRVFDRFRQADSSRARKHGGLGLGLAIVKNVVGLHGGTVEAKSDGPGRGAEFIVRLARAEEQPRLPLVTKTLVVHPELDGTDVLLVEDDDDSRTALELALAEKGARVRSAASVRQALAAYGKQRPDVLISDIGMPGEDGYVLIREIRELEEGRNHRTLAIAMTGFAGRQDREMALRAGFDEHVAKPVEPDLLFERVRVLEASRRMTRGTGERG